MAGTLSLAWLGLTGTDSIMTIAGVDDAEETASASPASAFTVVIDAGHGGFDGGAVGNGGTVESELNLLVAKELKNLLLSRGIGVYMTRTDEGAIG
ncbi:MAG: N-acetylmuramoyl-L-alanine amidase, partial [Clostridia bacterium]|nr:N-acetylmuramoyl-L-alanine amidase [Clostridia bacterium]